MQSIYPLGVSVFLYGLVAGYYVYSAIHNASKSPDKVRKHLLAALAFGFGAILLGWMSYDFERDNLWVITNDERQFRVVSDNAGKQLINLGFRRIIVKRLPAPPQFSEVPEDETV